MLTLNVFLYFCSPFLTFFLKAQQLVTLMAFVCCYMVIEKAPEPHNKLFL